MTTETGTFATPNASKYLQQLCKHFAHKTEVDFTETEGAISFGLGTARLSATDGLLTCHFELTNAEDATKAHHIIDKHLARFAFREAFTAMDWTTTA
ncbi:DUF2218 domain-containing protein [Tropicibacter sp. S64]|uniref:DUF2218 domain-containing protein n=1 Tax=Tropicibacter sp. S64 TaxID=3415122 RepID=UPI003C7A29C2